MISGEGTPVFSSSPASLSRAPPPTLSMEVQPHALPTFDNIPAFSFRDYSEFRISDISSEVPGLQESMEEEGVEWEGTDAPSRCPRSAAMKVQKVYRSYRTRRMLADSAVVAEELWWQAIGFARLNHSTISFFNFLKPESAVLRWNRISLNASTVGKGLSKDDKAQTLAFQHWIEAIDPRHRYGHSLHIYYDEWCKSNAGQPFFYWLDLGDGKEVDLKELPRSKLRQQCIKYLGPQERKHYEYVVVDGKLLQKLSEKPLDTNEGSPGSKWIFVVSTTERLYAGEKKKGLFHHSSFLAGGATLAAGRLVAENGVLKCISPYSGHYKPTDESLDCFLSILGKNGVDLEEVEIRKANEDYDYVNNGKMTIQGGVVSEVPLPSESVPSDIPIEENNLSESVPSDIPIEENNLSPETTKPSRPELRTEYKRTLSGGLQSPKADVPKKAILQRINSKNAAKSYQLGHQLSIKWSTGAGPRIGCVGDYPVELRLQALELTKLSPRNAPLPTTPKRISALLSPSANIDYQ